MVGLSTISIHGADEEHTLADVTPPVNISTTYKYDDNPEKLVKIAEKSDFDVRSPGYYSRLSHPNGVQVEAIISKITNSHAVIYSSGLSAFYAALVHYNPKVLAIGKGYHGCHGIANIFSRNQNLKQIGLDDDFSVLGKGDVVHLETPVNPEGLNFDISHYAKKAHERGAFLIVDSTFGPPPLQDPFQFGADLVLHSASKYFGGHSDLLAGVLITKDLEISKALAKDRLLLGTNIGNLESSLLLRSLKTLEIRVFKQSDNATQLVKFLVENKSKFPNLLEVKHGSLQKDDYIKRQMPKGHSPTFSIIVDSEDFAKRLPSKLQYFHHATSLGGVESLIEWRAMSDPDVDPRLLRVSVGIEDLEDLISDFTNAFST